MFLLNSTAISATVPHAVLFRKSSWSDCYRLVSNIRGLGIRPKILWRRHNHVQSRVTVPRNVFTKRVRSPMGHTPHKTSKRPLQSRIPDLQHIESIERKLTYDDRPRASGSSVHTPSPNWTDKEDEALTKFVLLSTLGDKWPASKGKIWDGASTFLMNMCGTKRTSMLSILSSVCVCACVCVRCVCVCVCVQCVCVCVCVHAVCVCVCVCGVCVCVCVVCVCVCVCECVCVCAVCVVCVCVCVCVCGVCVCVCVSVCVVCVCVCVYV